MYSSPISKRLDPFYNRLRFGIEKDQFHFEGTENAASALFRGYGHLRAEIDIASSLANGHSVRVVGDGPSIL